MRKTQLELWSSGQLHAYFTANAGRRILVPWERGAGVTPAELASIGRSLAAWQLGETSDGSHLLAAAERYAASIGDPLYVDVVRLFICEEQGHGEMLGRFLDLAGVPRVGRNWGDTVFRALRYSIPSLEVWATPVIMVETHALIYYNAIRRATRSLVLRRICEQILADEVQHVRFQYERLAILHKERSRFLRSLTIALHRVLYFAVTLAVWCGHRRALRAGGYGFGKFWRSAWSRMNFAWRRMHPAVYRADANRSEFIPHTAPNSANAGQASVP